MDKCQKSLIFTALLLQHVTQKIQGAAFQKMCSDIASSLNLGTPSFAAAKDFLQGAGQGSIIQQVTRGWIGICYTEGV